MKEKLLLLGFIFLNILILSAVVHAANDSEYSFGINKDMEITLEVKTFDKDGLKDIFSDRWDEVIPEEADEVGMRYRIKVIKVDKDAEIDLGILGEYDAYGIEADVWEWTKGEFAEDPTDEEKEIVWFKDPEDINDAYEVVGGYAYNIIMPFVPISVVKFLDEIDEWKEDKQEEWKTKDNMVIHDSIFDEENFVEIYIYDTNNGFLTEYKIKNEDGVIIYEYGLSQFIPGYEIPLLLGIIGISVIGLIYIMKKKL
ncbi:MAG: hypothetical protein ACFFAH_10695 [Promethearchaeota archaeon]